MFVLLISIEKPINSRPERRIPINRLGEVTTLEGDIHKTLLEEKV